MAAAASVPAASIIADARANPGKAAANAQAINGHVKDDDLYEGFFLPTSNRIGNPPKDVDANAVANEFLARLASAINAQDAKAFTDLFWEHGWLRDRLALTWSYRSIYGLESIRKAFETVFPKVQATDLAINNTLPPFFVQPYPDIAFIQFQFTFNTVQASNDGLANLIYVDGKWKLWSLTTLIDNLKEYKEADREERYVDGEDPFEQKDPEVLICGGGISGLSLAAHLKAIGIPSLIVDKHAEGPGSSWAKRYDALSLHSPSPGDSLPFLPFPKHWPYYPTRDKVVKYIQFYAEFLHLNIWNSTLVKNAKFDQSKGLWTVEVIRDGAPRTIRPKIFVLCTGFTGAHARVPTGIPGQESFKGDVLHSTQFKSGKKYKGKTVLVVGTASTGCDITGDVCRNGADTHLLQRGATYVMSEEHGINLQGGAIFNDQMASVEMGDKLVQALPFPIAFLLTRREVARVYECDREIIEGLNKAGFETYKGRDDLGHIKLGLTRGGGYYFDTGLQDGVVQQIIRGEVKVHRGSVDRFTEDGVVFDDGSSLKTDAVIWSTGYLPIRKTVEDILGKEESNKIGDLWSLSEQDHELKNDWKPLKVPNLFTSFGGFVHTRFHSKMLSRLIAANLKHPNQIQPYED